MPETPFELLAALDELEALLGDPAPGAWPTQGDDLALVRATRERLERRFTLAVVGEFSSGKSYLLNALLGRARYEASGRIVGLLATDINPSPATITELEYGIPESAVAKYPSGRVQIAGNCDDRGTEEYNLALGQRRANAAKDFLVAKGVSGDRITTISYGKDRPTALGDDEQAWAQNRNAITSVH